MYGHTHRPVIEMNSDILAINPGKSFFSETGESQTFLYNKWRIDDAGDAHFTLNYLD